MATKNSARIARTGGWILISVLGALALGLIAFNRGEPVNSVWLLVAALCVYAVAYRFYSLFIAEKILRVDPLRPTPALRFNDGLDYVPTERHILFGHHFAAIAGAGPLVGPVLAAQMGYLPGTLWILIGVVFAGAVQDMVVLFISTRRDAKSLGEIMRAEMGNFAGALGMIGIFLIMILLLAVLALVIVKALAESPWGTFTVFATLPIAVFMGLYERFWRPGRVGEMSLLGFLLLMAALIFGRQVAMNPAWAPYFTFSATNLSWILMGYGLLASVMPVWLVLAPRDYLSTFLKIGVIGALAAGILWTMPFLRMPALTAFVRGNGPVFSGGLFPFLFITIACGSVSGFHSLIASGTTPKMIASEAHLRFIGYGGMLMESFVAIMALTAAASLDPGVYFAMNSPAAIVGSNVTQAANVISGWGFPVSPDTLTQIAHDIGESTILARAGGAPTLAVGMAQIFSNVFGSRALMGFWYHFAILFEAMFILTAVDAGTRVARFMIQDLVGSVWPKFRDGKSWTNNLLGSALAVGGWGYIMYGGVVDPLGGINSLWPLFGISNQMLAGMALILCTVVLFRTSRRGAAWITGVPAAWLMVCTFTAGAEKIFHPSPSIGFISHAKKFAQALRSQRLLAPAQSQGQMEQIIRNDYLNAILAAIFLSVLLAILTIALKRIQEFRHEQ